MQSTSTSGEILTLAVRQRLHEYLTATPGAHLRDIARSLRIPLGTVVYHVDLMEEHGILHVYRDGRYKRHFVADQFGPGEKQHLAEFHHGARRGMAKLIADHGPLTQRAFSRALGLARSTVSVHASHLVRTGVLLGVPDGRETRYELADPDLAARALGIFESRFGTDEAAGPPDPRGPIRDGPRMPG